MNLKNFIKTLKLNNIILFNILWIFWNYAAENVSKICYLRRTIYTGVA